MIICSILLEVDLDVAIMYLQCSCCKSTYCESHRTSVGFVEVWAGFFPLKIRSTISCLLGFTFAKNSGNQNVKLSIPLAKRIDYKIDYKVNPQATALEWHQWGGVEGEGASVSVSAFCNYFVLLALNLANAWTKLSLFRTLYVGIFGVTLASLSSSGVLWFCLVAFGFLEQT